MSGCFFVLVAKSRKKGTRHDPLSFLRALISLHATVHVCTACVSGMHVVLDVDGAACSCHHAHSRSQGADEGPR